MAVPPHPMPEHLVLFDGVCNLCNGVVRFLIARDPRGRFHFATLQGATGRAVMNDFALEKESMRTLIYLRHGKVHLRSSAALHIARDMRGLWPLAYGLIIVPRFLRDAVYDLVAHYRYRWFGRTERCMLPTPAQRARFLDD